MQTTNENKKEIIFCIVTFCSATMIIPFLYMDNILLTLVFSILIILGVKFWRKKYDIYFFLAGFIIGPISEIICISFGVWQYANQSILGIPIWLPLCWGAFAVLIKRTAEFFIKIEKK